MSRYNTIKVQQGNDFELHMKPVMLNGKLISASELTDISVKVTGKDEFELEPEFEVRDKILAVKFNDGMDLGLYNVIVRAKWQGNDIEDARRGLIEIVEWTDGIQFTTYKQELVLIGTTNAEIDALREQYEQAIREAAAAKADAEATKTEYLTKMDALKGIAKEASLDAIREYLLTVGKELTLNEIKAILGTKADQETLLHAAKEATLSEMKATQASMMAYLIEIKTTVDAINTRTAGTDVKIDTINTNTANTKGKVYELDTKTASLSANLDTYKAEADAQRAAIKTVVDEIDGHLHPTEDSINEIKLTVGKIDTRTALMDGKVDTIGTNTANTKGKVYELDGKVAEFEGYKADADAQRAAIKTVVDEIEGHLHPTE